MTAFDRLYDRFGRLCSAWAVMGGALLCVAMIVTVVSVIGRAVGAGPVDGDFEIMEIATAVAVFAFMPHTQMKRGHVIVDVFTQNLPRRAVRFLDVVGAILISVVALIWMWRTPFGAQDFFMFGDETTVLRFKRWWSFIVILPSIALFAGACLLSIFKEAEQ